ncbi:down syndrome cell adhesion molecule-like protein Dscam2 [Trichonephila clavipes]|nr:down syndrome cell adhesion molecule-like protein Dscam2 [Trichonephila clavipes]
MTGTLSYRPEETGGRQREKSLDTRHRRLDDRYRVLPWPVHGGGLFARRPVRCVPLTPAHRRRRSLWCREHRNWKDNERGRVLFTDESRFSLSSDSHRILIWRERGSHNHPSNIIERGRYGGRGVFVWGGIMLDSRTDLHIFDAGSVIGTRYCNEILLPYVRLFRGAMDEPPVLEEIFSDKVVYPGVSVSLKCMATGSPLPQVTWRLDSLPLPEQLRFRVGDYVTRDSRVVSYVNITSIQVEDGGLFSCKATNEVGSVLHSARVNVFGPPTIRSMPNITALAGEVTVLPCPAGGHPLSSITWSRDSRNLPQNHRQQVFPNGTLIIREVNKKADEGKYTCTAENKDGDRSQKDVYVQLLVTLTVVPLNLDSNFGEGMEVFKCLVSLLHADALNSHLVASPLVRLKKGINVSTLPRSTRTIICEHLKLEQNIEPPEQLEAKSGESAPFTHVCCAE